MNGDKLIAWAVLDARKQALGRELEDVKNQLLAMEGGLLEEFADAGVQSVKLGTLDRTVYANRRVVAKVSDKDEAAKLLKATGFESLVSEGFNSMTLAAVLKEFENSGRPLPEEWAGVIEIGEVWSLRSRKAT